MKIIFEDFHLHSEINGGYYDPKLDEIHIDSTLSVASQVEVFVHEVLEKYLSTLLEHEVIEEMTMDIMSGLGEIQNA